MARKNIAGVRYGYLVAIKPVRKYYNKKTQEWIWLAKCDCGKFIEKRIGQFTVGDNKSCGCMSRFMKSQTKLSEKNPNWTGDKVGLNGLHSWVKRRLKKPETCDFCNNSKPYDLANKGIYDRNLDNWEWLCRKCHMTKDGRIEILIENGKKNLENYLHQRRSSL